MWLIDLLTGGIGKWVAGAVLALISALGLYAKGRADAKAKAENKAMQADLAAHERMNDAPTLRDASDDDRVKWLRDFARRNRSN